MSGIHFVSTHTACAKDVKDGKAGAAAREARVDFIPLFEERYDLVIPGEHAALIQPLLDHLQTASFRQELNLLTGYNTAHSGEQIPLQEKI